jgi:hypothetical protein
MGSPGPNADGPLAAAPPTERTPLLSEPIPRNDECDAENGTSGEVERLQKHPMADKMHILLPAVGVGVHNRLIQHAVYLLLIVYIHIGLSRGR